MSVELEVFPNPGGERPYLITHTSEEFTSVCPKTGHPDFGRVVLRYVPGATCLELKALKLYYQSFRNQGIFYEAVSNRLLDDLFEACEPRWMEIETQWKGRGGISSVIRLRRPQAPPPEGLV
jgi:7-cyano-7-deazaguanine reductase